MTLAKSFGMPTPHTPHTPPTPNTAAVTPLSPEPRASAPHRTFMRLGVLAPLAALVATQGCLDRPISPAQPATTNLYVHTLVNRVVDKVDLLFMIDNSGSMADKQQILSQAVPVLVQRLATPRCVDDNRKPTGQVSDSSGHCTVGRPEFSAVKDMHIGVVTSSLGSHGGTSCLPDESDAAAKRTPDDRAELLPTANPAVRGPIDSWNGSGFLAWDPTRTKDTPAGTSDLQVLTDDFRDQVEKAGENGCGFEGSLEAWYRFLVDPEPPSSVTSTARADGFTYDVKGPINETLLAQRKAFLRPDSLLAIVMLTDENDCSINDDDGSQGWIASQTLTTGAQPQPLQLPRASSTCATAPDDRCCHSCNAPAPDGCTPNASDTECVKSGGVLLPAEDSVNLRCFEQKRRFGLDLLYPTKRYVDGLTQDTVRNRAGAEVPNPLFVAPAGAPARGKDLVLLAGIIGVPWQDIATADSLTGPNLEYLTAADLDKEGRWDVILGDESEKGPTDPLMHESIAARSGANPVLGAALAPPGAGEGTNPINGHEQNILENDDLQYACTFRLPTARTCEGTSETTSCDCTADRSSYERPLCDYPNGPDSPGSQHSAKAYPGLRELDVLHGVAENAIVASICPKNTQPAAGLTAQADVSYGYNPAVDAIGAIFTSRLAKECLPRSLPVESDPSASTFGQVPCAVVEAVPNRGGTCSCDASHGRLTLGSEDEKLAPSVVEELRSEGRCDGTTGTRCDSYCLCKVDALSGSGLRACQAGSEDESTYGYCYIDPAQGIGNAALIADCPATTQRSLRFVGDGLPANGSLTFMACEGSALDGVN